MIEKLDPNDQRPTKLVAKINELIDWVNEHTPADTPLNVDPHEFHESDE